MARTGTTAATLQIRKKNGDVLLHQGYGWLDADRTRQARPDTMMRIYSITKSFTHLAINQLAANRTLSKNAKVFCLNNETPSGTGCLLRVTPAGNDGMPGSDADKITVQHLLDHMAGWDEWTPDTNGVYEPSGDSITVAGILNMPSPPGIEQLIAYQLDQALDYRPGTRSAYSNFGYMVLGHIIEQYSGMAFMEYIYENVTDDLGIPHSEIELASELVAGRNPREPRYISGSGALTKNIFDPAGPRVTFPDGGIIYGHIPGAGGIITTTSALLDYMHAYWLFDPSPRNLEDGWVWIFGGAGDGGMSLAAQGSPLPRYETQADFAVILNRWPANESLHQDLQDMIRNTLRRNVTLGGNSASAGSEQFFTLYVPENSTNLRFNTESGSGDFDLYVRFGARPTTSVSDCNSVAATGTGHFCTIPNPLPGTYYVMTHANTVYNGVFITGNYD